MLNNFFVISDLLNLKTNDKMEYCPPNITLSEIWINHGISHCFMDTVSSSIIAGFILIFGTIQLIMYRKYSTLIDDANQIAKSKLYNLQILLLIFVPSLAIIRFILEATVYDAASVYGYMVYIFKIILLNWFNFFLLIPIFFFYYLL